MFFFTFVGFVTVVALVGTAIGIITGKLDIDVDVKVK
jgi:hypothetical protein